MNALAISQEEEQLVLLLASFPRSSAQVLMAKLNPSISQPTFSRRIEAMERRGIVKREGRGRSTVYSLVDPQWYLNLPVQKRTPTTYRFEWLENFAPHQHRFLAAEEDQRLHELGIVPGISPNLFFQRVYERFLIDLSYASSKMEGNTYTLLDTEKLLKEGSAAEGKAAEEATMILNHKEAIVYLVENLAELSVSERDVKNLHALLSRDLVQEGEPGRLRTRLVNITNTAYSPLAVPQQIDEQFKLLVQKANEIASPFEQSIFLLVGLSYLQPFIDVNKRTARLAANIPLFKAGLCPLSYRHMDNARYMGGLLLFYETLNADGITAAFVDGYEKSSSVLKSHYEEHRRKPDRVDLAYRRGTNQVIREVILYGKSADDRERIVTRWLATAPEEDRDQLLERINAKLEHIGTDEAALYGVTPEDIGEFLRGGGARADDENH